MLLAACGSPPPPREAGDQVTGEALRTDRTEYVARRVRGSAPHTRYAFTLIARYTNRTGAPVYLSNCFPDSRSPMFNFVVAGAHGTERSAYDPAWACVGHDNQIVVQPGAARIDTFYISGSTAWNGRTGAPIGELEGRLRLMYYAQSCPGEMGCPLPDSLQRSNEFEVRIRQ
jgi:hypothetical protein